MKVVVVDWDITYPVNSGKRLRTLNLMRQLAPRHDITYFSRGCGDSSEGKAAREFLNDQGIETVFADVPLPRKSSWRHKFGLLTHLCAADPLAACAHYSSTFAEAIRKYAAGQHVDLWQVEWTPYIDMLPRSANVKSLVSAHNVDSLIWQRYFETEQNPLRRTILKSQWKKFVRFEKRMLLKATRVAAVSETDAHLLRQEFGLSSVDVVENGVDVDYYCSFPSDRDPHKLLFLGSLDWRPNLDAINTLLDDILPRLRRSQPLAKLEVVGRNPPAWLTQKIAGHQDVTLHADVPDVRPFLATAGMMVVPLRIGGGSRLKILEALASSLPVVSSTIGAEGLELTPESDLQIADRPDEMVQAIMRWMSQPKLAAATARRGFEVVKNHYDWERLAQQLEAVWERTANSSTLVAQPC